MNGRRLFYRMLGLLTVCLCISAQLLLVPSARAQDQKPNIVFIMGDDIGWMQPSIYHRGLTVGETPWSKSSSRSVKWIRPATPASSRLPKKTSRCPPFGMGQRDGHYDEPEEAVTSTSWRRPCLTSSKLD
jgi:hypothetical protein